MEPITTIQPMPQGVPAEPQGISKAAEEEEFPIDLPDGLTEQMVVEFAKQHNKAHESAYKEKFKRIVKQSEMYENRTTNRVKSDKIISYPTVFGIVETIYAKLVPAIFGKPKYVEMAPDFPTQDNEQVLLVDDFVNQKLQWACRVMQKAKQLVKALVVEGTAVVESVWKIETEEDSDLQYEKHPETGEPIFVGEQSVSKEYQCWDFNVGSILSYAWDPNVVSGMLQDSSWARKRTFISQNELYRWEEQGKIQDVDQIEKIIPASVKSRGEGAIEDWEKKRLEALGQKKANFTYSDEKEYLFEEWYAFITWKAQGEDGEPTHKFDRFHFYMVENTKLVMFERNKLKKQRIPWANAPFNISIRDVTGKGVGEPIEYLYDQINTFAGKQADNINRIANPPTYYDRHSGLNGRATFMKQQGMIPVDDATHITTPKVETASVEVTQKYINFLLQLSRDTSGATEQAQGTEGADTATEFQGLVANAMSRFSDAVGNVESFIIKFLAEECLLFHQQFGQDNQMFVRKGSVEEGECVLLTRQMIQGRYEAVPTSSQNQSNKMGMIKLMNDFITQIGQLLSTNPNLFGDKTFDIGKFVTEKIFPLFDVANGKEFFVQKPPMPPPTPPPPPPILDVPGKLWYEMPTPGQAPSGTAPVISPVPVGQAPVMGGAAPIAQGGMPPTMPRPDMAGVV